MQDIIPLKSTYFKRPKYEGVGRFLLHSVALAGNRNYAFLFFNRNKAYMEWKHVCEAPSGAAFDRHQVSALAHTGREIERKYLEDIASALYSRDAANLELTKTFSLVAQGNDIEISNCLIKAKEHFTKARNTLLDWRCM